MAGWTRIEPAKATRLARHSRCTDRAPFGLTIRHIPVPSLVWAMLSGPTCKNSDIPCSPSCFVARFRDPSCQPSLLEFGRSRLFAPAKLTLTNAYMPWVHAHRNIFCRSIVAPPEAVERGRTSVGGRIYGQI